MNYTIVSSLLLIFLSAWPGWGATYYIDPTCSSSGDGTTTSCGTHGPFKTWAELGRGCGGSNCWAAGNTYSQKGGTTAYETITVGASGTIGNVITINSYGTGQAIINGAVTISDGDWTNEGGGIYSIVGTSYYLLLEGSSADTAVFLHQTAKANLGSIGNYYDYHYSGDGKTYYAPTDGVFAGHIRQWLRPYGINTNTKDYITIDNIAFTKHRKGIGNGVNPGSGYNNITVTNCTFSNTENGIFMVSHDYNSTNLTIQNNNFDFMMAAVEIQSGHGGADEDGGISTHTGTNVSNNTMTNIGSVWTSSGPASYTWQTVWYPDGLGTNDLEGIGTQNSINGNFYNNNITGIGRGIIFYATYNNKTTGNNVYSNFLNVVSYGIVGAPRTTAVEFSNNSYHHNIFINGTSYLVWLGNVSSPTTTYNYFYNNTLIAKSVAIKMDPTADYWDIKNNIFYNPYNQFVSWPDSAPKLHFIFDYNLYYPLKGGTGGNKWYYNPTSKTWTTWRELGFDQHSPTPGDPLFTNGSGQLSLPSDFTFSSKSPAKWAGVDVAFKTDYARNAVHNPPSIGAYEFIPPPISSPTGLKVIGR
jgi:hypothetical protein